MVVLVDTNILLDYILKREPFLKDAEKIMECLAEDSIKGYVSFHSISNIWYILGHMPSDKKREWLNSICDLLTVTGASHDAVKSAINNESFSDFEDCLQDICAENVGAKYIITRNEDDFSDSSVESIHPKNFLELLSE